MFKKDSSGYTLIEIILAIAILGLVLVPVLGFMTNSSGIITYADKRERALLIVQQRMEYLKSLGYVDIGTTTDGFITIPNEDEGYPEFNAVKYNISSIKEKIEENTTGIYDITIKVSWDSKDVILKSKLADR